MSQYSVDYSSVEANLDKQTGPSYIEKLEEYQNRIPQAKLAHASPEGQLEEGRSENMSLMQDVDFRSAPFRNSRLGPSVTPNRSSFILGAGTNLGSDRSSEVHGPSSNPLYHNDPQGINDSRSHIQGRFSGPDRRSFMDGQRNSQYDDSLRPPPHGPRPMSLSLDPNGLGNNLAGRRSSMNPNSGPNGLGPVGQRRSSHLSERNGIRPMNRNSSNSSFMDTYSMNPELIVVNGPGHRPHLDWLLQGHTDYETFKMSIGFRIISILSALFIMGDAAFDWYVSYKFDDYSCSANSIFDLKFYKYDICNANMEVVRQALVVFTMSGSILAVIQTINIFLSFMQHKGKTKFQICQPLSEVFVSNFLSDIPQAITLLVFMFNCECSSPSRLLSVGMMMTGFMKTILRYMTAFNSSSHYGCFRTLCCCCRNESADCELWPGECFCSCALPCPFSSKKKSHMGICILENLGILCLFCCIVAGLVLLGLSNWS